jgi:hypothetical protein
MFILPFRNDSTTRRNYSKSESPSEIDVDSIVYFGDMPLFPKRNPILSTKVRVFMAVTGEEFGTRTLLWDDATADRCHV